MSKETYIPMCLLSYSINKRCTYLSVVYTFNDADVAQLGEHETEDLRVAGSIPAISTFLYFSIPNADLKIKPNHRF